jgi:anaerobic ribonucleoside-triphosphate reductase
VKIDIKLSKNFMTAFNKMSNEYGEEMLELNGFSDDQLGYTTFIDNFIDSQNVADASIDGNANVSTKDICSLTAEMSKPHSKLLAFNKIFFELNKKYGFKVANEWLRAEWSGAFYLHDASSSTFVPYCFAYDLDRLVNEGLYFIDNFNNGAPQHLTTYTDFVGEFVSWAGNRSSGKNACRFTLFLLTGRVAVIINCG